MIICKSTRWVCQSVATPWFLFSSRRRHTIWTGDWSSDVCSSDLDVPVVGEPADLVALLHERILLDERARGVLERAQHLDDDVVDPAQLDEIGRASCRERA